MDLYIVLTLIALVPLSLICYAAFGKSSGSRICTILLCIIGLPLAIATMPFGIVVWLYFMYKAIYSTSDPKSTHYDIYGQYGDSKPVAGKAPPPSYKPEPVKAPEKDMDEPPGFLSKVIVIGFILFILITAFYKH